ncbi:MAG: hypothetical protein LBL63_00345, partial [Clostridiales Family XIII bacterium]|nr:hypothetical protein [Clostridiales Family XIII bacterium]
MDREKALKRYVDARAVTKQLDALIELPIYAVSDEAMRRYEREYFDAKCAVSKERTARAKDVIPGGVQHNLAFNYPFPLVFTRAKDHTLT